MHLTSFIAGFLGSLSPCVYPLIPITLSVMGVHRNDNHWHGFKIALSYVLGMLLLYTTLGIVFAYAGILAGSSLQSPWVNGILALLMLLMALNLMGVFELTLPQRFNHRLAQLGAQKGHRSAFLMGLAAGILAVPCTGPILAGILTMIAKKRDLAQGISMMLAYALGMGIPFLLLGTFSSSVSKLPKSGPWMARIKILLGVLMLGLSAHYARLTFNGFGGPTMKEQAIAARIAKAHQADKKVILDFWADWCSLCHDLDEKTFKDPAVIGALKDYTVIRVDVTIDSEETRALQEHYGVVGLPTLVFVESGQKVSGFVSPEEFLEILNPQNY